MLGTVNSTDFKKIPLSEPFQVVHNNGLSFGELKETCLGENSDRGDRIYLKVDERSALALDSGRTRFFKPQSPVVSAAVSPLFLPRRLFSLHPDTEFYADQTSEIEQHGPDLSQKFTLTAGRLNSSLRTCVNLATGQPESISQDEIVWLPNQSL
jgi:hypothetical protein